MQKTPTAPAPSLVPVAAKLPAGTPAAKVCELLAEAAVAYAAAAPDVQSASAFDLNLRHLANAVTNNHRFRDQSGSYPAAGESDADGKPKPRLFLAMPRYGAVERESDMAAFMTASNDKLVVRVFDRFGSALPFSFNQAWCEWVNSEQPEEYFALLHADVAPEVNWADTLIEELERHKLDALHAVVAIKDGRGLTSTAIGCIDTPWAKPRRITCTELQELPVTFTAADVLETYTSRGFDVFAVGGDEAELERKRRGQLCMFCNTGCLLVRYAPWCRDFTGFQFLDRIITNRAGRREAQFFPEDWGFGQWCAQHGLKVGGTRKVAIQHIGRGVYGNEVAWGQWKQDEYFKNPETE